MFRLSVLFFTLLSLAACESLQQKNAELLQDRETKLKPLNQFTPMWCRVETRLTAPAEARYSQMFPDELTKLGAQPWAYTWKARKASCEITPLDPSPLIKSHQAFLETAMCMLLQVHWVNSPFAGLVVKPEELGNEGEKVHLPNPNDNKLGIFLDPQTFEIETRTKTRGVLIADYAPVGDEWLPKKLEQRVGKSIIRLDQIEYGSARPGQRQPINAFWISIGEDKVLQFTHVILSDCQGY